ncbi:ankyrin repeat-containing domain protein [Polychytrium aggregatum]|uniref:ankyrin repeat-containing domain protein n=1 Tax=Polychytrium aggregatum TaxID=110093 RepID=UPI0022FEB414|nr:ankyrin repeat-containing domain protein [Polychytrium aggregatum]KAI9203657.1 ankyrin repeat-containing domain protein [Polychytrium aggregatum]
MLYLDARVESPELLSSKAEEILFRIHQRMDKYMSEQQRRQDNLRVRPEGLKTLWDAADVCSVPALMYQVSQSPNINIDAINPETGQSPLHYAARHEDGLNFVSCLLRLNATVDLVCSEGRTALYFAAAHGYADIARQLLASGANPNAFTKDGMSPLLIAAQNGHLDVIRVLGEYGVNLLSTNNEGESALYKACEIGSEDIVQYFVQHDIDVNGTTRSQMSDLLVACVKGHLNIVKQLLANGARLTDRNLRGASCLYLAAQNGHMDVIRTLADAERKALADFSTDPTPVPDSDAKAVGGLTAARPSPLVEEADREGWTPLIIACWNGDVDVVKGLVEELGADIHARALDGTTALYVAVQRGNTNVFKLLLEKDAEYAARSRSEDSALSSSANKPTRIPLVNQEQKNGWTPLMVASLFGCLEIVQVAVRDYNADIATKSINGTTALYFAAQAGHINIVRFLIDNACATEEDRRRMVNQTRRNAWTPLMIAAGNNHPDVVRCLVDEYGADLLLQNSSGQSALFVAVQWLDAGGLAFMIDRETDLRMQTSPELAHDRKQAQQLVVNQPDPSPAGKVLGLAHPHQRS